MVNQFLLRFKKIPIGTTGLGVGLAGIGSLYSLVLVNEANLDLTYASIIQFLLTSFTLLFVIIILFRNITHKHIFSNEIKHPMLSSFLPTICMSSMQISGVIALIGDLTGNDKANFIIDISGSIIWYAAVISHITIFSLFIWKVISRHNIKQDSLYASWFVPPVGIIVSCTVANYFTNEWIIPNVLFQIVWYFGFSLYVCILPIVSYKLIFHRQEDKNTLPSIAIFGAPANLLLAGFLTVFTKKVNGQYVPISSYYSMGYINTIVIILTFLGLLTTIVVYLLLFKILRIKFNPTYASLTFPLAIGATAMYKSYLFINTNYNNSIFISNLARTIQIVSFIEIAIATVVIMYVFIRYIHLIVNELFIKHQTKN